MASDTPDTTLEEADARADATKPSRTAIVWMRSDGDPLTTWLSGRDELVVGRDADCDVTLDAPLISRRHARLRRTGSSWFIEDLDSRNGTSLNGEAVKQAPITKGDVIRIGASLGMVLAFGPKEEPRYELLDDDLFGGPDLGNLLGQVEIASASDLAVVLEGPTGTGKEQFARAIHRRSGRKGPFLAINCAQYQPATAAAELFGYRKGAFSGAAEDRPGLVRSADRGTLFLDEIGDLPLASQAAFLRVLQEREVVPVGGTRPVSVDIRLIAATHRDLDALIAEDSFREDLYSRISGIKVTLPPLRERREDLGLLIATLLARSGVDPRFGIFDVQAARALFRYHWPMNIRELEKTLAAAVVLAADTPIECEHLPAQVAQALVPRAGEEDHTGDREIPQREARDTDEDLVDDGRPLTPEDLRRKDELTRLLRDHKGNISAIARVMGKARMQIQRWCKRYRLDPEAFRK